MVGQKENRRLQLNRERMRFVYEALERISTMDNRSSGQELVQKMKGLPVELRMNGLAVVVARLAAEKKDILIGNMMSRWLLQECPLLTGLESRGKLNINEKRPMASLLLWCRMMSRAEYQAVQKEAMSLLEQAKLISAALKPGE